MLQAAHVTAKALLRFIRGDFTATGSNTNRRRAGESWASSWDRLSSSCHWAAMLCRGAKLAPCRCQPTAWKFSHWAPVVLGGLVCGVQVRGFSRCQAAQPEKSRASELLSIMLFSMSCSYHPPTMLRLFQFGLQCPLLHAPEDDGRKSLNLNLHGAAIEYDNTLTDAQTFGPHPRCYLLKDEGSEVIRGQLERECLQSFALYLHLIQPYTPHSHSYMLAPPHSLISANVTVEGEVSQQHRAEPSPFYD
jgi:hypothetical protein